MYNTRTIYLTYYKIIIILRIFQMGRVRISPETLSPIFIIFVY